MESAGLRYLIPRWSSWPLPRIILSEPSKKSWTATRATGSNRLNSWSSSTAVSVDSGPIRPPDSIAWLVPPPISTST